MATLEKYQKIIQNVLTEIHDYDSGSSSSIESQIILDNQNNHYLLVDVGWEKVKNENQYVYGTIIHIDIKDDKIWIQRNHTEIKIAERLVQEGIPPENIVLGFHSPFLRQFSGYAVS